MKKSKKKNPVVKRRRISVAVMTYVSVTMVVEAIVEDGFEDELDWNIAEIERVGTAEVSKTGAREYIFNNDDGLENFYEKVAEASDLENT